MKRILRSLLLLLFLVPFVVSAKGKVKVYMFEAGGCPYCEAQEEYLKGLDSYGEKFELVKKELYVDHVNWEKGKDYDLGVSVAKTFKDAGFEDASADGTPFVVISDLYAQAGYSTTLEDTINEAYEAGDKDVVACIEKGEKNCLKTSDKEEEKTESSSMSGESLLVIISCAVIILIVYIVKSNTDKKEILQALEELLEEKK